MSSLKFGKILGISLELHSTFLLMMVLIVLFLAVFDPQNMFPTLLLLFFLFVSVFIHELFHSAVAVMKGIKVSKITLLPIGGLSMTEELPEKPLDEFLIAVAGPFFNFLVVVTIIFASGFFPAAWPQEIFSGSNVSAEQFNQALLAYPLFALFWVNLILGGFNLFVPALPLDGGRVLRAILATRLGFSRATSLAAKASKAISVLLFLVGFFVGNIFLTIIAVFIFLGANQETEIALIKEAFFGLDAKKLANKRPQKLGPQETIQNALDKMIQKKQTVFVVDMAKPAFISVEMLEKIKKPERSFAKVADIAQYMPIADEKTGPQKIFTIMVSGGFPVMALAQKGKITGYLFEEELYRLLKIKKTEKQIN